MHSLLGVFLVLFSRVLSDFDAPVIPHYILDDGAGTQNLGTIYLHRFITTKQAKLWANNHNSSDLPYELLLKGRRTFIRATPQLVYACRVPPNSFSKSNTLEYMPMPEMFLQEVNKIISRKNNSCILTEIKDWSYNFCFDKQIDHFAYFGVDEKKKEAVYYLLGNATFSQSTNPRRKNSERTVVFVGSDISTPWYVVEKWTQGTICDLTGIPRVSEIRYSCHPMYNEGVFKVEERSVCNYIIHVHLEDLCGLRPLDAQPEEYVFCSPITEGEPLSSLESTTRSQDFSFVPPERVRWLSRWRSQLQGQNRISNIRRISLTQLAQHITLALSPGTLSLRYPKTEDETWASPVELYAVMHPSQKDPIGVLNVEAALDSMLAWGLEEPDILWWDDTLEWEKAIIQELLDKSHYLYSTFSLSTPAVE